MAQGTKPETTIPRIGRPPRLTRTDVVAVTRRLAAREGIERLSMRRLAEALGVAPNTLYTYFPDKASILDAVLDDLVGDVERPRPRMSWRRGLVLLMSSYRGVLLAQPGLIALTVSRPMIGPNALRLREDMLALLKKGALSDSDAVNAYFALFAFTTGFVAFEMGRAPGKRDAKQRAHTYEVHTRLSDQDFPATRALARRLRKRPGDPEFIRGLNGLTDGFAGAAAP